MTAEENEREQEESPHFPLHTSTPPPPPTPSSGGGDPAGVIERERNSTVTTKMTVYTKTFIYGCIVHICTYDNIPYNIDITCLFIVEYQCKGPVISCTNSEVYITQYIGRTLPGEPEYALHIYIYLLDISRQLHVCTCIVHVSVIITLRLRTIVPLPLFERAWSENNTLRKRASYVQPKENCR